MPSALLALLAGLALGGCGAFVPAAAPGTRTAGTHAPSDPSSSGTEATEPATGGATTSATDRTVARADRAHEVPTPARPERPARGWSTPEAAVRAFAVTYVNWTAATVGARLRALARESVGQARAALQLQAGEVASDSELRRGRIANSGTVEAVARLPGAPDRYLVVTRERTSAADDAAYRGLAPEWHVSVATVERVGSRWALSGWQPEN